VLSERSRIAREIHDTLAQNFVAISAQLETVARLFRSSPDSAIGHLDQARILVRSGLAEARRSVMGLRPLALEGGDLPAALREIADQLALSVSIEVQITGRVRRLAPALEANLLRIAQEAITNAVRHAQASLITVEVDFGERSIRLIVADDGLGFDAEAQMSKSGGRLGLIGMRERSEHIGAALAIDSRPGRGTRICLEGPAQE
jgi:signal transduction histidine kinase